MALEIPQESNDTLLVNMLGIKTISVFYDDLEFARAGAYSDLVIKPTSVSVTLSDVLYDTTAPTADQQFAIRTWVAGKTGVDVNYVEIS
jgi:hypothetical protein